MNKFDDFTNLLKTNKTTRCLLLVTGMYKTGSSYAAMKAESQGYFNPAALTNPNEFGHSSNGKRYWTRECSVARSVSRQVQVDKLEKRMFYNKGISGLLDWTLDSTDDSIVLKSPLFLYSLKDWIEIAEAKGVKAISIICSRDRDSTLKAWKSAPWTAELYKQDSSKFEEMFNLSKSAIDYLKNSKHLYYQFSYEEIYTC